MHLSFAPMEGITYYTFRNLHNTMFPGADRYYSPFIAPDSTGKYKAGSYKEVLPENNPDVNIIPQILANNPEAFLSIARELAAMGYNEVNLNAGCPSGTVFSKHKGAGMLADLCSFEAFLTEVFEHSPLKISIKTRMGVESTAEFGAILELYNRFPISELIIHARDRKGMYKSCPDFDGFLGSLTTAKMPVSYNGNVYRVSDYERVLKAAPGLAGIMIGRGAVSNPALFRELAGGAPLEKQELQVFMESYLSLTLQTGLSEYFTVNRMKELWYYMEWNFPDASRHMKRIYKCRTLPDYRSAVQMLFEQAEFSVQGFGR